MNNPSRYFGSALIYVLMALPGIVYLYMFATYAINMPFYDDYDAILGWMSQFLHSGTLQARFLLLFQQHNEHRIVFVHLVQLSCFYLFHRINFLLLSFVGSLGLFSIVAAIFYAGKKAGLSLFELIPIPIFLLTLAHYQLIYFAMAALQQYWQLAFDIFALLFLTRSNNYQNLALALLFAISATFTGGGGLLVFPAGLFFLVFSKRWIKAGLWSSVATIVLYIYFVSLQYQVSYAVAADRHYGIMHPIRFLEFSLQFLGSFGHSTVYALIFGAILAALLPIALALGPYKRQPVFLCISMFILASALIVGVSRTRLGPHESIASRYAIYGLLNLTMTYLAIISAISKPAPRRILSCAGVVISLTIYLSWLSPALANLRYWHTEEKTHIIWYSADAAAQKLRAAMQDGVFFPTALYRHLPSQIESNATYCAAWDELFEIYLTRPDLQASFPLTGARSYKPLLEWAATTAPGTDQADLQLRPYQAAYKSMLRQLGN